MSDHRRAQNNVTCATLPPLNVVSGGDCFQTFNPPVKGIVLHLLEDFICFAHEIMILNAIAQRKRIKLENWIVKLVLFLTPTLAGGGPGNRTC